MKRMKQVLALLLALVLALSLTPTVALADPPQGECREGGEHIWDVYSDSATCTQAGERMWRCRKCGIWWRESSPALGHDWREGEIIESEGLLGPVRVRYVCNRCYEVRVETTHPNATAVLNRFRNVPADAANASGLVITLQPVGGVLPAAADASCTLTVAAEGGVEPYTYEWHGVDKGVTDYMDGSPVGYAVHSNSRRATEEANRRRAAFFEAYLKYTQEHFGVEDMEGARRGWTELQIREYGDIEVSSGDSPSYDAEIGNCYYYCIVRDSSGKEACSDSAFVGNPLYIYREPVDAELSDGKASLVCTASGGSGNYSYTWYLNDRDHELSSHASNVTVKEPGEYFCCVRDGDQEVTSVTVTVAEEPAPVSEAAPVIVLQPKSINLNPKSNNHYSVTLHCKAKLDDGSAGNLRYQWQRKGNSGWVSVQNGNKRDLKISGKSGNVSGQYRCIVYNRDNGKRVCSKTVQVQVTMSVKDFRFRGKTLHATIRGGVPPYKVLVVQVRNYDSKNPKIVLASTKAGAKGIFNRKLAPKNCRSYTIYVKEDGEWVKKTYRATYYIVVYDSLGQKVSTTPIRYPD